MLEGLIKGGEAEIRGMQKDIYLHDAVAGATVDLTSQVPFGRFSLSGVPKGEILNIFLDSLQRMRIESLLPALSINYMVEGAHLSALGFNKQRKIFDAVYPFDLDYAEVIPVPIHGHTPLINLKASPEYQALNKMAADPRAQDIVRKFPEVIQTLIRDSRVALNPENTLYIPRRTFAQQFTGISAFRRLLPIYILEKALLRGTAELAYRRQRGVQHITAGNDMWIPSNEELKQLADLFLEADTDPISAVVATRPDVMVNELASGGDTWKWTDTLEALNIQKFRALGVSDSILGGDSNVSGVESGMTVFMQQNRAYRDLITRLVFYEKVFPYISVANDFRKEESESYHYATGHRVTGSADRGYNITADDRMSLINDNVDLAEYHLPVMIWHNQLRPEGDNAYLGMLFELSARGIPVPMRMLAAAAGISLNDILYGMDEDLEVQKSLAEYRHRLEQYAPPSPDTEGLLNPPSAYPDATETGSAGRPKKNRDFQDLAERLSPNVINGHRYVSTPRGRKQREEKANRVIAEAAAALAEKQNRATKAGKELPPVANGGIYGYLGK